LREVNFSEQETKIGAKTGHQSSFRYNLPLAAKLIENANQKLTTKAQRTPSYTKEKLSSQDLIFLCFSWCNLVILAPLWFALSRKLPAANANNSDQETAHGQPSFKNRYANR
jgi:hypothetical protein